MNVDLNAIKQKGLVEKAFEFSYEPAASLTALPQTSFREVNVSCLVELYDDEVLVSGTVLYTLSSVCSRCLAPVIVTRTVEFDERFLSVSNPDSDEEAFRYSGNRLCLDDMVDQLILTDMPYSVYCKDDCKGICPECGQNLNDGDCGCNKI